MSLISRAKADAKRAYEKFYDELDQADCGKALLKEVNPRAAQAAHDYNEAIGRSPRARSGFSERQVHSFVR